MENGDLCALTLGQKYQVFPAQEIQRLQGNGEYLKH